MTLRIESRGAVAEGDMVATEDMLSIRFPESYRNWMLRNGGGELEEDVVIPQTAGNGLLSEIDTLDSVKSLQDVDRNRVVPPEFVVITLGHGGSLALRVRGGDEGSVWWADYDKADELGVEEPTEEIMLRLADDFDSFLALFP